MEISITTGGYEVIKAGTVSAFEETSDVSFTFVGDATFSFILKLVFASDESGEQIINRNISGNMITLECTNFSNQGTGTSSPIELATFEGKKIYIRFWAYLEGDYPNQKKTRKIEYTFYAGK